MRKNLLHNLMSLTILVLVAVLSWFMSDRYRAEQVSNVEGVIDQSDWLSTIKKETLSRTVLAKMLLQSHFPKHDLIVLSAHPAPGGILSMTTSINNKERSFIIMPDNKNFVEGTLNSPYLNDKAMMPSHTDLTIAQAKKNTDKQETFERLKNEFKVAEKLPNGLATSKSHQTPSEIKAAFIMPERKTSTPQTTKRDLLEKTKSLESIIFGDENAPSVYVYFDFQCSACLEAHKTLTKLYLNGLVKIHYIPVGVQGTTSVVKAAYTLIPADNEKRKVVFDHMRKQIPIKKLITTKAPESELKKGLTAALTNKETFMSLPSPATPTFLYEHDGISYISTVESVADIKKVVQLLSN